MTTLHSKTNSEETNTLASSINQAIEQSGIKNETVLSLNSALKKNNDDFTIALNKKQGSDLTPEVGHLENKRDQGLKCLFYTVQGATYHLIPEIAEQAKKIYEAITRHGRTMYNLPDMEQTSKMKSLFEEFQTPELAQAIEQTNTSKLLKLVKKTNQEYLDLYNIRSKEQNDKDNNYSLPFLRKEIRISIDKLNQFMDTMVSIHPDDSMESLYEQITNLIAGTNAKVRARLSRKDNKDDSED